MRILIIALCAACGTDTAPVQPPAMDPPINACGPAPQETDYPTLQAWRDEAVVWMTCARFTCSEIIIVVGQK